MSWVSLTTEEQAGPETKQIYKFLGENWGFVPNYFQALGAHPQLLQDQVNLFTDVMFQDKGRALPRIVREQVALVVSGINLSNYCLAAHLEILGRLGIDKKVSRKLVLDYTTASVEPKVMALFRFADKLSRHPADDSSLPARSGTYDFSPDHRKYASQLPLDPLFEAGRTGGVSSKSCASRVDCRQKPENQTAAG